MADRITVERLEDRPAWEVRVEGQLVGIVWRKGREFGAVEEGSSTPAGSSFSSLEAGARAVARRKGFTDLEPNVVEVGKPRGPERRPQGGARRSGPRRS